MGFGPVLDELENRVQKQVSEQPPTLTVDVAEDDFGDFASGSDTFGLFGGSTQNGSSTSSVEVDNFMGGSTVMQGTNVLGATSFRSRYIRAHKLLRSLAPALLEPPHQILSSLFPAHDRISPFPHVVASLQDAPSPSPNFTSFFNPSDRHHPCCLPCVLPLTGSMPPYSAPSTLRTAGPMRLVCARQLKRVGKSGIRTKLEAGQSRNGKWGECGARNGKFSMLRARTNPLTISRM